MNIAFLTHTGNHYGANRSLHALIGALCKTHHSLFLIAPNECDLTRELSRKGVRVAIVPQVRAHRNGRSGAPVDHDALHACRDKLIRQLQAWRISLVYLNSVMVGGGAHAARELGIPYIWHLREFGDLDYDKEPLAGWESTRRDILLSNATISVSHAVRRHYCESRGSATDFVIDNGVIASSRFDVLRRQRTMMRHRITAEDPFTFILVGALHECKGQATAIRALASLNRSLDHARLVLVGGGTTERLRKLAGRLGVRQRVTFTGYVTDPINTMLTADAALMCSRCEAFGRVTAEAMATGLPVIGRNAGGTPELITDGATGMLYDGDEQELAGRMTAMAAQPGWTSSLGDAAWTMARARFSIERYVAKITDIVESVGMGIASAEPATAGKDPSALLVD